MAHTRALYQSPFSKTESAVSGNHQVVQHPHIDQGQRGLEGLGQVFVSAAGGDRSAGVVMGQHDRRRIEAQGRFNDFPWVDCCRRPKTEPQIEVVPTQN